MTLADYQPVVPGVSANVMAFSFASSLGASTNTSMVDATALVAAPAAAPMSPHPESPIVAHRASTRSREADEIVMNYPVCSDIVYHTPQQADRRVASNALPDP
jgi:hypothetical protein